MAKITGVEAVNARLRKLAGSEKIELVGRALFAGGEELKATAQHLITENSISGANHVPSVAPNPPNNDSGTLKNNIFVYQLGPLHVRVTSEAPYAAIHEFGGTINHPGGTPYFIRKDGTIRFVSNRGAGAFHRLPVTKPHQITIPARPYMAPAAHIVRKAVVAKVQAAINLAVKE